jgi:hypothetical protein
MSENNFLDADEIPEPIADNAPTPDQFDAGEEVHHPGTSLTDVVAVDYDGERYCRECANPEYVRLCKDAPRQIPHGGPVDRGSEVDCPGSTCGHCLRRIADMTVLHYDGVCQPDSCPEMDS